jgi:Flp pilus assembly protein TadD
VERAAEREAFEMEVSEAAEAERALVTAEDKLELADQLQRQGRVDKAALAYLGAHERDPTNPVPQERIGFLQVSRKPEDAEEIFRSILREMPERAPAHAGLGLAHYAQGDLGPARDSLERAVEIEPDDVLALSTLAVVYDMLDRHEEAQLHYGRIQALRPDDPAAANNLGVSLMLLGKFAEAESTLRRAVDLAPKQRSGWNNLGIALGRQEQYDKALEAFRKGGDEQGARNNLGYVYFLNGRFEQAIVEYEAALLEGGPATPTVIDNLDRAIEARDGSR